MKLNFYQAWHFHYIARIKQPFKLWLKTKPQGKMKFFGEVMENGMYDVPDEDGAFESQLGRVADGVANRVDRLKAIGNGQVPLVAATTFRLLKGVEK